MKFVLSEVMLDCLTVANDNNRMIWHHKQQTRRMSRLIRQHVMLSFILTYKRSQMITKTY